MPLQCGKHVYSEVGTHVSTVRHRASTVLQACLYKAVAIRPQQWGIHASTVSYYRLCSAVSILLHGGNHASTVRYLCIYTTVAMHI